MCTFKWMTLEGMSHLLENAEGILRGDEVAPLLHLVVVQREAVPGEPQNLRHHALRGGDAQRRPPLLQLICQLLKPSGMDPELFQEVLIPKSKPKN